MHWDILKSENRLSAKNADERHKRPRNDHFVVWPQCETNQQIKGAQNNDARPNELNDVSPSYSQHGQTIAAISSIVQIWLAIPHFKKPVALRRRAVAQTDAHPSGPCFAAKRRGFDGGTFLS
jgi:hypothetical protein